MKYSFLMCGMALSAYLPLSAGASDRYWAYTYKDIDVTASGSADQAKDIAHNLHRLDLALAILLGSEAESWRAPTRVYVVPQSTFSMMWKKSDARYTSIYFSSNFDNKILINTSLENGAYFDAYYGYTGSLLASGYSSHYPLWYRKGLAEVLGASKIERDQVIIGGFIGDRVRPLVNHGWIPIKTLLNIGDNDPQLASGDYLSRFSAECWFLVHQILIEQRHHSNFRQYFARLDQGEEEPQAYAASFDVSYENLDKEMHDALGAATITMIKVRVPDQMDAAEPRRLSDSEATGRLAAFAAVHGEQIDGAIKLANEALAGDAKNEDALIALARVHERQHEYPALLQSLERLCAFNPLSQNGSGQCAYLYADLIYSGAAKNTALGVDAPTLADRSRKYFETAISGDPEDLSSWSGMAYLLTFTHNVEHAKDFLPRAKHVWATHPRNETLARVLAGLCATTGDFDTAIKFATVWRKNARTGASSSAADAYLSRLETSAARKAMSDAPDTTMSPAAVDPKP
jgi:tetratricopeptide (TPR) repeat protein